MMPVPLALTLAGLTAGTAYLRARFSLDADMLYLKIHAYALSNIALRERLGRLNFFYVLEEQARNKDVAKRPCLLIGDHSYTYAEVHDLALRYGTWLKTQHGVQKHDVVAMDFRNVDTFVFLWFGLWSIGARPAFINHNLTGASLAHSLRVTDATLALIDPAVAHSITDGVLGDLPGMRFVVLTPEVEAEIRQMEPVRLPDEVRSEEAVPDIAMLIFTSGTTGLPKASVVSWAKVWAGAVMSSLGTGTTKTDVLYTCMPLYHSSASLLCVCNAMRWGAASAIGLRFSTRTFWREVRKYDATIIQYIGELCRYLVVTPPELDPVTGESLDQRHRVRVACGNGLRADVWDRFKERFNIPAIFEFYSATESAGGTWNLSRNKHGRGAVGRYGLVSKILHDRRAAIVALDPASERPLRDPATGFCVRVRAGEVGELLFRLPENDIRAGYQGFYGNQAATLARVLSDVFVKGDAYFRTGDAMRWDHDRRIFFVDRLGDTFRWKGENVSTAEVADALGTHPAVCEANVYGVELPRHDGRAGCAAIVFATPSPGPELLRSVAEHAQKTLPRYAVPLFLRVEKELGLQNTSTCKQLKTVRRQQGVAPANVDGDLLFWLRDGTFVPFTETEWKGLEVGAVRL